jgi:hypothetical protein
MMTESRGPGSSPIRGGAVSEDDPESTTNSPPRPLSDPGISPPLRRRSRSEEETSESESGSALQRRRKRKRVTGAGKVLPIADSAGSGSDSSAYSSPLREPKAPLVTLTEDDGTVSYFMTDDRAAVEKYYRDVEKYDEKMGNPLHPVTFFVFD